MNDKYLNKKVEAFDPIKIQTVEDALSALKKCGFQGRNLGEALDILEKIEKDPLCLKVLTLSGALTPAGMGKVISVLIERKMIDIIVTTGAIITHDLANAFTNEAHFQGSENVDDDDLYRHRINRIYDVFLPEKNYLLTETKLHEILDKIFEKNPEELTPSKLYKLLGDNINEDCILSLAAKNEVPIFIPANTDSELALDLITYQFIKKKRIELNELEDVIEFAKYITDNKYERYATIVIGGGTPRNWAQQIFPLLDQIADNPTKEFEDIKGINLYKPCPECNGTQKECKQCNGSGTIKRRFEGYDYSIRIHTAVEYDGGLSGCTISESKSWGKYAPHSKHISIWCDATIAFPLLITACLQRIEKSKKQV